MKNKILDYLEIRFFKWLIGWAKTLEGIVEVLSLGFLEVRAGLPACTLYSRRKWQIMCKQSQEANRDEE